MTAATSVVLSILVPVRNEGVNLRVMLKVLKALVEVPHEVLVIHDTPDDDCVPLIAEMQASYPAVRSVHNDLGRGVKFALNKGISAARGDYILIFAADEVGPLLAIDEMLGLAKKGCDFISCTRYALGGRRLGGSWIGKLLSITANTIFHKIMGGVLTDSTTGIKMFRREIFKNITFEAKPIGWAVVFEMAIKAQLMGLKVGEVPIISIDRLYGGQSTFKLGAWTWEYLRWFIWGTRQLRRKPRGLPAERLESP